MNYPYMKKDGIARMLGLSKSTVYDRARELDGNDRYGPYAVIRDGQVVLINVLCFLDWLKWRRMLMDKNLKRHVPPYDPRGLIESMGMKIETVSLRRPKM